METTVDIHLILILILMDIVIKVKTIVDDIAEKMPDQFNMHDIMAKCEERTPYIIVCFQVNKFSSLHNTAMFDGCPLMFEFFLRYQPSNFHFDLKMEEDQQKNGIQKSVVKSFFLSNIL